MVTHNFIWGPQDEIFRFLTRIGGEVVFVKHPFEDATEKYSEALISENGKTKLIRIKPRFGLTPLDYMLDFVSNLFFFAFRKRVDVFIGADPSNAFSGLLLRKLNFTKYAIYYSIDYSQKRFNNQTLNKIYHLLDGYCARNCDYTWNVSPRILMSRKEKLNRWQKPLRAESQMIVRVPVSDNDFRFRPMSEIERHTVVYSGTLRDEVGLDLVLDAVSLLRTRIPDIKLVISGRGPLVPDLKASVSRLDLQDSVKITDYIPSREQFVDTLSRFAIGLAIYKPLKETYVANADVSKVKVYAACGLPVIITKHSYNSKEVENSGAGMVVDYSRESIAEVLGYLLTNDEAYLRCREAASRFAQQFRAETVFSETLAKI